MNCKVWWLMVVFCVQTVVLAIDEPVSNWGNDEGHPSVSGSKVAYHYQFGGSYYNVYVRDLANSDLYLITHGTDDQKNPDIDGNLVVWQDDRNGDWDIYMRDLETGATMAICTESGNQENPRIDGHMIVWQDFRNGNWDIYGYDLETQQEVEIYAGALTQVTPDVSVSEAGPIVVWQHYTGSAYNIRYKNLDTNSTGYLDSNTESQYRPRIDYPRVVWYDYRNGNADIYMYTFGYLLPVSIIENNTSTQVYPSVSGRRIVWADNRNGNWDIYCGDLEATAIYPVCVEGETQYYPDIDENLVVWEDERDAATRNSDIYMGAIGADSWHSCTTLLDFEFVQEWQWPEWTDPVDNMFEGVTFSASHDGCEEDYVILDTYLDGETSSGNIALGNYNGFTPCEFVSAELTMIFDKPQSKVTFYVGSHCGDYDIYAYDDTSELLVDSEHFNLSCDLSEHGVHRYVELTSEDGNINRIVINSWGIHVRIDDLEFNYDGTPPTAQLEEPDFDECTCGVYPIMGIACDGDRDWVDYTLSYCPVNSDTWTEIVSNRGQICDVGLLAEWDTTGMSHGRYFLKLEVTNECGLTATDMTVAFIDKVYNTVEIRYPHEYTGGTDGVVRGSAICIDGTVWDHLCYDATKGYEIEYREKGEVKWLPVAPGPIGTADVLNDPLGTWNTISSRIADGYYEIRVSATDLCGNYGEDSVLVNVDNTPPDVEIVSPSNCDFFTIGDIIDIMGIAEDENLTSWTLSYVGGTASNWTNLDSGTAGVKGKIFSWDTSGLVPCCYTIRLRAWDAARNNCSGIVSESEHTVTVKIGADLNGDGCVNLTDFSLLAAEWLEGCTP